MTSANKFCDFGILLIDKHLRVHIDRFLRNEEFICATHRREGSKMTQVVQMTFLEIIHLLQTFTTTSRLLQTSNVQQIQRKFYFLEFWVVLKWAWTHLHFIAPPAMLRARKTLIHYTYLMYFKHLYSVLRFISGT